MPPAWPPLHSGGLQKLYPSLPALESTSFVHLHLWCCCGRHLAFFQECQITTCKCALCMRYTCFVSVLLWRRSPWQQGSQENWRRFLSLFWLFGRFEWLITILMDTNTRHTCSLGLVWPKQARPFSQFGLKAGELGFPIHFVCSHGIITGGTRLPFYPKVNMAHSWCLAPVTVILSDRPRRRHPSFLAIFRPSVWPCSCSNFSWFRTFTGIGLYEKRPTRSEIWILEFCFPWIN